MRLVLFLISIIFSFSACSPQKKLMGEWRWVTYEISPTKEKIPSKKTLERIRKLHQYYSTNYFQSIGLVFRDSNVYEHYAARGVNWGTYRLKGKKLRISEVFLSHKRNTEYQIKKINSEVLHLEANRATLIFERDLDPAYEAAKNNEPINIDERWSNKKKRGLFEELLIFDIIQTGNLLEGTVSFPERLDTLKKVVQYKFNGEVAGTFAKIFVIKQSEKEKKHPIKTYELRFKYEGESIQANFVRQRYLDKEGKLMKFLGEIDSPFPRKMILNQY